MQSANKINCKKCANYTNCPRNIDQIDKKFMYHCNYYVSDIYDISKAFVYPFLKKIKIRDMKSKNLSDSKKRIISEIIERRKEETQGMLKIYCKSCNIEMDKVITIRKVFHRCPNYENGCDVNADPLFISQAVLNDIVTHAEYSNISVRYEYDDEKNIVKVSTMEQKL